MPPASPSVWIRQVPNLLTVLRLMLAAALPFVPRDQRLLVVLSAAVSDGLDGWIARRFHATSHVGRLLDGAADKAFALSVVSTLVHDGSISLGQGLLVLTRDLIVTGLAVRAVAQRAWSAFRHMRPRLSGKLTTLLAFLWFLTLLIAALEPLRTPAFVLAALASVAAAADYLVQYARLKQHVHHHASAVPPSR